MLLYNTILILEFLFIYLLLEKLKILFYQEEDDKFHLIIKILLKLIKFCYLIILIQLLLLLIFYIKLKLLICICILNVKNK